MFVVATLFVSRLFVVCCRTSSLTSRLALAALAALVVERAKAGDALERGFHVVDRDQPRAFELARRVLVPRAPQEILVVEAVVRVVPAAVAGVVVDHPVGRGEFSARMAEAADQDDLARGVRLLERAIVHQDGHLYLIGYDHGSKNEGFLEFRIDRIDAESIKLQPDTIDGERRRRPVEFSYWIDGSIAKSGLSQRWLAHTIEREEAYIDENGKQRRRVLVRAKAYNEWRIIQQLHKYGDKAELVSPPKLREQMRKEVERMHNYYQK